MKRFFAVLLSIIMIVGILPVQIFTLAADEQTEYKTGDIIEFGSYPKARVTDESLINKLDSVEKEWISYNYVVKSKPSDYMKYADIEYQGERYRAVIFSRYRSAYTTLDVDTTFSYQQWNEYEINTVYYFKYEPIQWIVLDPADGFVMSKGLIDAQPFVNEVVTDGSQTVEFRSFNTSGKFASDYATSDIREWLIGSFMSSAFSVSEQSFLKTTELEPSISTQNISSSYNPEFFTQSSVNDKVFLLSREDVKNTSFGFEENENYNDLRACTVYSDYAVAQGLYIGDTAASTYHKSMYYLRSSYCSSCAVSVESKSGKIYGWNAGSGIDYTQIGTEDYEAPVYIKGIRPAIVLSDINDAMQKHNYQIEKTILPTCTEKGYTTYTCADCGDSYNGDYVDALGHDFGEWTLTTPATCESAGEETRYCSRCDAFETRPTKKGNHEYTSVVTDPTCTEKGYTTYTCTECGDTYTDNFTDALGHDFGEWQVTTPATCTSAGEETRYCSRCDEFETRETASNGHTFEILIQNDSSCVLPGKTVYKCTGCGEEYTEEIPVKPHSLKHIHEDASCTADGEDYDFCLTCGESFNYKKLPANGHNYVNGVCTVCGNLRDWEFSVSGGNLTITKYKGTEKNLVIPDTLVGYKVASIADYAFKNCGSIEYVRIPDGVTSIGKGAFEGCGNLKEVFIGEKTASIGSGAFASCPKLALVCVMNQSVSLKNVFSGNDKRLTVYAYENSSTANSAVSAKLNVIPFAYPKEKDGKNAIAFNGDAVLYQDLDYNLWGEVVKKYPDTYYLYFRSLTFDGVKDDDFSIDIDDSHIADSESLTLKEVYIGLNLNGRQLTFRELIRLLEHGQLGTQIEFVDEGGHKKTVFEKIGDFFSDVFNAISRAINSIIRIFKRK